MQKLLLAIVVASVNSAYAQEYKITCTQQGIACVEYTLNQQDYETFKAQCKSDSRVIFNEGHVCPPGPSCYQTAAGRVAATYFTPDISIERQRAICDQNNGTYVQMKGQKKTSVHEHTVTFSRF